MPSILLSPLLTCLGLHRKQPPINTSTPHHHYYEPKYTDKPSPNTPSDKDIEIASQTFITTLLTTDDPTLLTGSITPYSTWSERLALRILEKLTAIIQQQQQQQNPTIIGSLLKETLKKVVIEAYEFAEDHPVYCTLLALGVLVQIGLPWVLGLLGFAELGPVEGSFAAWWMARYSGYLPKESLYAFLQRLGMVWKC